MNIWKSVKYVAATIAGVISNFLGGWDIMLQVLLGFVVLDYITGVVAAAFEKKLDSSVGFKGIARKVLLFVPIGIAYQLDVLLGQEQILRNIAVWFYVVNEGLSVMENLGRAGVPLPDALINALQQLKSKSTRTTE